MDIVEIQRAGSQRADVNANKRLSSCRVISHGHVVEMLHDWLKAIVPAPVFFIIAHL